MAIQPDSWIRERAQQDGMIEPFEEKQTRDGVISYGLSSYGYDARVADEFRIFTNVDNAIVDPKNFANESFVERQSKVCIIPPIPLFWRARWSIFAFPVTHSSSAWANRPMRAAVSSSMSRRSSQSGKGM